MAKRTEEVSESNPVPGKRYDEIAVDPFLAQPSRVSRFISDYFTCPRIDGGALTYEVDDTPYVPPIKWQIRRAVTRRKIQRLRRQIFPSTTWFVRG
jgi:hypothetical protein